MTFLPELEDLGFEELVAGYLGDRIVDDVEPLTYYQEVGLKLRDHDPAGFEFLLEQVGTAEGDRLAGAFLGLSSARYTPQAPPAVFLAYLDADDPLLAAEAIDSLSSLYEVDGRERVLSLADHPNEWVRSAVVRYITHSDLPDTPARLRAALTDPAARVRFWAANGLDDLQDPDSREAVRPLLDDPDEDNRWIARRYVLGVDDE